VEKVVPLLSMSADASLPSLALAEAISVMSA